VTYWKQVYGYALQHACCTSTHRRHASWPNKFVTQSKPGQIGTDWKELCVCQTVVCVWVAVCVAAQLWVAVCVAALLIAGTLCVRQLARYEKVSREEREKAEREERQRRERVGGGGRRATGESVLRESRKNRQRIEREQRECGERVKRECRKFGERG